MAVVSILSGSVQTRLPRERVTMDSSQLLLLSGALAAVAWALWPTDPDQHLAAVRSSLSELATTMAVAACAAGLAIRYWPAFAVSELDNLNLKELNLAASEALTWLQRGWLLPFAVACGLLGVGLAGKSAFDRTSLRRSGGALGWALKVKSVAAVLAATSLTVAGWQAQAGETAERASRMQAEWAQLRLDLAMQAQQAAEIAMAEALAEVLPPGVRWPQLAAAHARVAPYLPQRPETTFSMQRASGRPLAARIAQALPDLPFQSLRPAGVLAAAPALRPLDDGTVLMRQVMSVGLDHAMLNPLRESLTSLGNPHLDELVGAFIDPVVSQPVREWIVDLALRFAAGADAQALREHARQLLARASQAVVGRWSRALDRARRLGAVRPPGVVPDDTPQLRAELARRGVQAGEMDAAVAELRELWAALDALVQSPAARQALLAGAGAAVLTQVAQRAHDRQVIALRGTGTRSSPPKPAFKAPVRIRGR